MKLIKILAIILAIMELTAACGSSGQPPRDETARPPTPSSAEPAAQAAKPPGAVTINFDYQRMKLRASDQLAVWIEDGQGNHVKTLLVTRFTAAGGYEKRPAAVLNWQKAFRPATAKKETLDAISTATPQSGALSCAWDCRNQAGEAVPAGSYVYKVEAILNGKK